MPGPLQAVTIPSRVRFHSDLEGIGVDDHHAQDHEHTELVVLASDETLNNQTTLTNVTDMDFAIAANEVVLVRLNLNFLTLDATPGGVIGFSLPTGATIFGNFIAEGTVNGGTDQGSTGFAHAAPVAGGSAMIVANGGAGLDIRALQGVFRIVNSTTAGNVQLQWAQDASSAVLITMEGGSLMSVHRVE